MSVQDKIRALRRANQWTQDEMADKMGMSKNGYGKFERGETKMGLEKLEKVAQIFNVDVVELINSDDKSVVCVIAGDSAYANATYYGSGDDLARECEKLRLEIQFKEKLLEQQEREIRQLQFMLGLVQEKEGLD
ncbi:MAG: helix-turn-helix transcriptional regulator [Pseudomonadota bacterium]|nr:helix-turn-helix transcriptional regulator [Pseudomonadota bacterium]